MFKPKNYTHTRPERLHYAAPANVTRRDASQLKARQGKARQAKARRVRANDTVWKDFRTLFAA